MKIEELQGLIKGGENERLEIKSGVPSPYDIARNVASFANTSGGHLLLGVKESGSLVGVDLKRATLAIRRANTLLPPDLKIEPEVIEADGKRVVSIRIPAGRKLASVDGGFYRRSGASVRPLQAEEIEARVKSPPADDGALKQLAQAVSDQTKIIDALRNDFNRANSLPLSVAIAVGGAILGVVGKYLVDKL